MVGLSSKRRFSPIGVDIGSRSIKLVQLNAAGTNLLEMGRWDFPANFEAENWPTIVAGGIRELCESKNFRGREAILCVGAPQLVVHNVRVARLAGDELAVAVRREAEGRLPFPAAEAEIRFFEAGDVRQGDTIKREVILLACHRPQLDRLIEAAERGGMHIQAIDAQPNALARCYGRQFRRDQDRGERSLFVHLGAGSAVVVIAHNGDVLFAKYLDISGRQMDEAVATQLQLPQRDAVLLRRFSGDRRSGQQDPEISRSVSEALRPILDKLANELSLCMRYQSVTFRGLALSRVVITGGEASAPLVEGLLPRLDVPCELGDPLRSFDRCPSAGHRQQWDLAAGLALRGCN